MLALTLLISACATKPFSQELLADGKTWEVDANNIRCPDAEKCPAEVKRVITARGKLLCGAQPFRVISCDKKLINYGVAKANCLLRCGEAPATAQRLELEDEL